MVNFDVKNKVIELTTNKTRAVVDNVYRETLKELLNKFGNLYYIDGNGNRVQIKCSHGDQDRLAGLLKKDNTLVLPYVTITDIKTSNSDDRRRYSPVIVSEKIWDPKRRRAERYLSLAPRPINLTYKINIWAKYKSDMDMIRSNIFGLFNPDINIRTKYSDFCKAYIDSEDELGDYKASDTSDRLLQKTITLVVETYIPSPKFLFTSTGEVKSILFDFLVEDPVSGDTVQEEIIVEPEEEDEPSFEPFIFSANLGFINLDLSIQDFLYTLKYQDIDLGVLSLSTSLLDLNNDITMFGDINSIVLSALDLSGDLTLSRDLGILDLQLTDEFLSESNNNFFRNLGEIEVYLTALNLEGIGVSLQEQNLQLSSGSPTQTKYDAYAELARLDLQLSSTDILTTLLNNQLVDLDISNLALSALNIEINFTDDYLIDLGQNEILLSIEPLEFIGSFNRAVDLSHIEIALIASNFNTDLGVDLDASSTFISDTSSTTTYSVNADLGLITLSATLLDLSSVFIDSYSRDLDVIQINLDHVELGYDSTDGVSYNKDLEEILINLSAQVFNTNIDELLGIINIDLSSAGEPLTEYSAFANLARIDLSLSSLDLLTELLNNQQVNLDNINLALAAIEFSSTQTNNYFLNIGQNEVILTTEEIDRIISDYKLIDLSSIEAVLTTDTFNTNLSINLDGSSNIISDTSSTTTYSVTADLGYVNLDLSAIDAILSATGNVDLGTLNLTLSALSILYDATEGISYAEDIGSIELFLSAQNINFNIASNLSSINLSLSSGSPSELRYDALADIAMVEAFLTTQAINFNAGVDLGNQNVNLSAVVTQITEYSAFANLARIDVILSSLDLESVVTNESTADLGVISTILSALDLEAYSTNSNSIDLDSINVILDSQQFNYDLALDLDASSNFISDTIGSTTYSVSCDLGQIDTTLSAVVTQVTEYNAFANLARIDISLLLQDMEVSATSSSSENISADLQEINTLLTLQNINNNISVYLNANNLSLLSPSGTTVYYEAISDLDFIEVELTSTAINNDIGLNLGTNQVLSVDPDFED